MVERYPGAYVEGPDRDQVASDRVEVRQLVSDLFREILLSNLP